MAKRFTDTQKYKKPFLRGLPGAYKIFWDYLYHECDHAGIWIVDFEIAQIYVGMDMPIAKENALKFFNKDEERVIVLNGGSKWFIPSFIEFQYGELNVNNRVHNSVIQILNRYKLLNNKGLISPIEGVKDKDMDKESLICTHDNSNACSFGADHCVAVGRTIRRLWTRTQSMPSSSADSCAGDNRITPSDIRGQRSFPSSSRL